jgi:protein-S-isoprenylcysteine O-methyltransferase Ste14
MPLPAATAVEPASRVPLDHVPSFWHRLRSFLIRRRVRITVVVFFVLILEDVVERIKPHAIADFGDVHTLIGLGLVLGGLALRSFAAGILHKRTQLTTTGPYALVRHPLYIGSFMMMLGFCALIDDTENIWVVLGPMLALYVYRTLLEERNLAAHFGKRWDQYAKAVPRFIPRRWPKISFATWRLDQWLKNREYNAVAAVSLGLIALQIWHLV